MLVQARPEVKAFDPNGFWRLPGIRDLDDAGRGAARELFIYRDGRARAENRPPFRVFSNRALVTLSTERPRDTGSLHQIKGISQHMVRKYGRGLLAAVRRGSGHPLAWEDRPRPSNSSGKTPDCRPTAASQARFEALRAWRNSAAEARGVEPDIVLTNQTLWAIAHRDPRKRADLHGDGLLAPWQIEEFGEALLGIIRSAR
jgi:ribonuclease D